MMHRAAWGVVLAAIISTPVRAQQPALARALDLERQGSYAAAATAYQTLLVTNPADPAALLGLERSLLPLNRLNDALPAARAALARDPSSSAAHGVEVRSWVAAGRADSARAAVERWARVAPGDEAPFREWVGAAIGRGDLASAHAGIALARQRLSRPDALAAEAAETAVGDGDWVGSLREWLVAIRQMAGFRFAALAALSPAPERVRPELVRELQRDGTGEGGRLAGALVARWGDPVSGFRMLQSALPADKVQAVERLNQFVEQLVAAPPTAEGRRAQGMALEAAAARLDGPAASRARMLAAQAYAEGGDPSSARRLLGSGADDRAGSRDASPNATATLIGVLLDEDRPDEAAQRLNAVRTSIAADEYAVLNRRVAWALARHGQLRRADSSLASDSTVEGLAVSGRVALLEGRVKDASDRLRAAGPYTGTRQEAASRASLLALLQRIEADTVPALGAALLKLEEGDSTAAVASLGELASALASDKGGAEVRLLAARIELARGHAPEAERLLRAADVETAPATAPAAELELGRLLIALGRKDEAVTTLEHLILTYSTSALVPQARRALDEARGAVPRT
jgi:tetratricopeptide (TPR) repeat protein